jgi:NADH-quinone oxidoreductase subunit N
VPTPGALVVACAAWSEQPPTGVFVGKLTVFTAAAEGGSGWLVIVAAVNTVASLFYYLRWLAPVFRTGEQVAASDDPAGAVQPPEPWSHVAALTAAVISVALGLAAGLVLSGVSR